MRSDPKRIIGVTGAWMSSTDLDWIKATASLGTNACLELAMAGDVIAVRDSKNPDVHLWFKPEEIAAFVAGAKAGEFDHLISHLP